ncbi:unnamed protein product [Enterobius vermicularis]|uniref:Mitochondrial inner membrane protein Mpv17 n=1 Tax=Enterobius vermicularis TaxID=51028 RepID=A0A0N4V2X3_ENTVE|nr:unnamed protein product [Enterobius vermicularis]
MGKLRLGSNWKVHSFNWSLHRTFFYQILHDRSAGIKFLKKKVDIYCELVMADEVCIKQKTFQAPILVYWYRILERVHGSSLLVPLKRLVIDQVVFAPVFLATILFMLRSFEGSRPRECYQQIKRDYLPILVFNLEFWPLLQLFNFYLMPLNFRVIIVQLGSLVWNTYFSYQTQSEKRRAAFCKLLCGNFLKSFLSCVAHRSYPSDQDFET